MYEIRECRQTDIGRLEARMPTGGHDAHAQHFAGQVAGACTYLIAWVDGQPAGSALILWEGCHAPENRRAFPDAVEISQVHVHSDARGRGVGTALIGEAERRIAERGRELITIGVGIDNPRAAALRPARLRRHRSTVHDPLQPYGPRGPHQADR